MRPGSVRTLGVRPAVQAGRFYPAAPETLRRQVAQFLADARPPAVPAPKAFILPHAGYPYSGPVAGTGYSLLARERGRIRRVILLGPAHYVPVNGMAVSGMQAFDSPLGRVRLDEDSRCRVLTVPGVEVNDDAHAPEHSLEVHLPFLQVALDDFVLVPILVGRARVEEVMEVLEALGNGPETCTIVSSDLSHFHDHPTASALDAATAERIVGLDGDDLTGEDACGCRAIRGLLWLAREHGMACTLLDLRNSGDTAGDRRRVVGYGAFAFHEEATRGVAAG
ncbi:MAG: AmmeMemoRadiSam system protein B [Verrucomicrobiales bacterium]|nr:AmmeMemoRadiSam system protein B [Verrucomicrobiales bacterium]